MTYTPFPVGEMPPNVKRWDSGPPYGRIALELDAAPTRTNQLVKDNESGEWFRITLDVDCGLGCRCAASAEWLRTQ